MTGYSEPPISVDTPPGRRCEPRSTQWLSESELRAKTDAEAIDFIEDCILMGCGDLFEATGGLTAVAVVLSPRLHAFISTRSDMVKTGAVKVTVQSGLFGTKTEDVSVPVYVQSPAPSDFRLSVVSYATLEQLKDADAVVNGLLAASAARVLAGGGT